jgi:glycosyltransferase involved in cell wall biosynthesis
LAVVSKYPPSVEGVSEYARNVVDSLARSSQVEQITVIANRAISGPLRSEPPIDVRPVWQLGEPALGFRILREIRAVNPDVIWYNVSYSLFGGTAFSLPGFALPAMTRRLGIPSIVTLHEQRTGKIAELGVPDDIFRRAALQSILHLLLMSDVVCVTTASHGRALEKRRTPGRARIIHLPLCGYDDPCVEPLSDPSRVLMLTSHAPHKNLPLLLDAFRLVRSRIPAAWLTVAGIDHPRFPGYLDQVRRKHVADPGVEWVGPVAASAMRSTFSQATLVVVPYRATAGSSATVHQAIGVGRPVISADLPELRAMAEEEDLWLEFFPPDNAEKLAEAVEGLLADPARRLEIAQHNLRSAQRNSLAATSERYLSLFQGQSEHARASTPISRYASGAPSR